MAEVTRLGRISLLNLKAGVARLSRESILTNANHAALARFSRMTIWVAEPVSRDFDFGYELGNFGQNFTFNYRLSELPLMSHAGPHKYWRLRFRTANGQPNVQYSEIFFLDDEDTDLVTSVGGSLLASSDILDYEKENAFDRNDATSYMANGHAGQWIGVEFASPVKVAKIKVVASHVDPEQNAQAYSLEFSDDGKLWTPVYIWRDEDGEMSASEERTFDIALTDFITTGDDQPHAFWRARFFVTGAHSERQQLAALDWVDDARYSFLKNTGGSGTVSAGSDPSFPVDNLFDFRPLTYWEVDTFYGYVVDYEFDTPRAVRALRLRAGDEPSQAPQAVLVYYSDDGVTWTLRHLEREIKWSEAKENRYFWFMDAKPVVYQDFAFNYEIKAEEPEEDEITRNADFSYRIKGKIADFTFDYKIEWSGKPFTFAYKNAFVRNLYFDYAIQLRKDFGFAYAVEGRAGQSFDFDYAIALGVNFDFDYKIELFRPFIFRYNIAGNIRRDFPFAYKNAIVRKFPFDYRIRLGKGFSFDYAIDAKWRADFTFNYRIAGIFGRSWNFRYNIRLGSDFSFAYNVTDAPAEVIQPPGVIGLLPEIPVLETWEYDTRVLRSLNNKEQRQCMRRYPRVRLSHRYVIDDMTSYSVFRDLLLSQGTKGLFVPQHALGVWADARTLYDATTVYIPAADSDFRVGEMAAFVDTTTEQIVSRTITAVASDHIEIDAGFPFETGRGVAVMPARVMRIGEGSTLNVGAIAGDAPISFEDRTAGRPVRRPGASDTLTRLEGLPYIGARPLASAPIAEGFDPGYITTALNSNLAPYLRKFWPLPAVSRSYTWRIARGQALDFWRDLADAVRGSWKPLLVPTFRSDLRIVSAVGDTLIVEGPQMAQVLAEREYSGLRLELTTGAIVNTKIIGATATGAYTEVKLADTISDPVSIASFINLMRIADDRFSFEHHELHSFVTLNLRVVRQ